ncbi:MAG: TonB-dependent receptor [Gammaproteobacteria bacterium]|nr:TonB-dependent receptor [Gammaproteobacteria bacterium]MBU1625222.1 TonB-dependent receptor [Gammaproteobacteria bacterium]MBU1981482.1 TonB-dependent receptor [Gammaproteobacteria bacterium]
MKRSCLLFAFLPLLAFAEDQPSLKEVTVTGKQEDIAARRDSTTQKVIIGRKDIENMGVMTIGEVLGKLPGVEVKGDGHRARGMSRDSVQILVDGERPAGGSRIVAGVVGRLPAGELERVEILRGSSAEYGGAASVTVNLVMKKPVSKRSTAVKVAAGMNGDEPTGQFTWTENGGEGDFAWTLPITLNMHRRPAGSVIERHNETAGVTVLNEQDKEEGLFTFREFVMSPRMTWKQGRDTLTVAPLLFDGLGKRNSDMTQTAASPASSSNRVSNGDRSSREEMRRRLQRLRVEGEKHLGGSKLTGRVSLNHGTRDVHVLRFSHDAVGTASTNTDDTASNEHETSMAFRLDRPLGEQHLLAVGLEHALLKRSDTQTFSGVTSNYADQERQSILWLQDDWMLTDKTTFTYGLRGERVDLDTGTVAQQHGQVMPSLAIRWAPQEQWLVRSSLGAGLKMPRLSEISDAATLSVAANTPTEADTRGNPNLRPERSVNFEAVLERYLPDNTGVFGLNFYARSTQDFTEHRVQLEGTRWVDRPQNEGSARHWGWELDGKVRTDAYGWKGATVKAHLTLPHATVNDTRLGISRMARDTPKYIFSAGLDENLPTLKSSYGVSLQLSGRSVTDIPGEVYAVSDARTTLDAYWLYKLSPVFNLRTTAKNLLATDTVQNTRFTNGSDVYSLNSRSVGYRSLLVTLEGRW